MRANYTLRPVSKRLTMRCQKIDRSRRRVRPGRGVGQFDGGKCPHFIEGKRVLARHLPMSGSMGRINRKQLVCSLKWAGVIATIALWHTPAEANGIYRDGVGARSMSMGGADVAWAEDPLGALGVNPAGLGFQTSMGADLGLFGGFVNGHFEKQGISDGSLDQSFNAVPEGAFAAQIGQSPVTVGLAFIPDALMSANWHYVDPPGGSSGTISYGYQGDKSVIGLLRTALGLGVAINEHWSVGGSIGVLYNQNELITPYVFQTTPGLAGAKTLLNLSTSGWGVNGQFGVMFKPMDTLKFGLTYTTKSTVDSHGSASGNAGVQEGVSSFPFTFDAEVNNVFPQMVSGGGSWQFCPDWRAALQVDWIDWAGAFSALPVELSNGSNPGLPSSLSDKVPLNWQDEFVFRGGLEYAVTTNVLLRGGYSYGKSPVPDETLTPLTAAITESAVSAGIGCRWSRYYVDFGYEYDLPIQRSVGTSSLLSGEYSNTSIKVSIQSFALTAGVRF
jgi:long-chain fatty acid transport protein